MTYGIIANSPRIAVIGGGVNGLCCAWQLSCKGAEVTVFESGELMKATSSSSSKLLHGGVRYLENLEIRLVYEALHERAWWLENCPDLTRVLHMILPVYKGGPRPRWLIKLGLSIYDLLAGRKNISPHQWLTLDEMRKISPDLKQDDLLGGFRYSDGQMDDYQLGLWVAQQARISGATLVENYTIDKVNMHGDVWHKGEKFDYDFVVNAAGPWAQQLLERSDIIGKTRLDLVRGSHILFKGEPAQSYLLQTELDNRIFFVLPYQGKTLVGTTEIRQKINDPIHITASEIEYLLYHYNRYFNEKRMEADVIETITGLRPLITSDKSLNRLSREYVLEQQHRLITIYGGKWTTARSLGKKVANRLL